MQRSWTNDQTAFAAGIGFGLALADRAVWRRVRVADLHGEVALVTGGSRGLGFLLAREFGRQGCKLVICARDAAELERARAQLAEEGAEVLAIPCDVGDRAQVEGLADAATRHFGRVDILVNNAGVITVGPLQSMAVADFATAMDVMFWGALNRRWPCCRRCGRGEAVAS